jgi:hypothetical protein
VSAGDALVGRLAFDGVPDSREIGSADADRIRLALAGDQAAQDELEQSVAQALLNGASVRAVTELGLSPNTVHKYGRAHGWPTDLNRARFYESNWDRDEREMRDRAGEAAPPIACRRPMEPDRRPKRLQTQAAALNLRASTLAALRAQQSVTS